MNWHVNDTHMRANACILLGINLSRQEIEVNLLYTAGSDSGHPTIHTTGCSSSIDSVDVRFHGGASWLYNLFDGQISDSIHDSLKDLVSVFQWHRETTNSQITIVEVLLHLYNYTLYLVHFLYVYRCASLLKTLSMSI